MSSSQEHTPQPWVFSAHLQMDEATPHLHIDFVLFTTGDTEWSQWVCLEKKQLALVIERHGIEWEDKGIHDKHLSVLDYKKEQRAKESAAPETDKTEKQGQVEQQEQR